MTKIIYNFRSAEQTINRRWCGVLEVTRGQNIYIQLVCAMGTWATRLYRWLAQIRPHKEDTVLFMRFCDGNFFRSMVGNYGMDDDGIGPTEIFATWKKSLARLRAGNKIDWELNVVFINRIIIAWGILLFEINFKISIEHNLKKKE